MGEWRDIESAPADQDLVVMLENGDIIDAILRVDIAITEGGNECNQWHATTDFYPECWTDGACWQSNSNMVESSQPLYWRIPA